MMKAVSWNQREIKTHDVHWMFDRMKVASSGRFHPSLFGNLEYSEEERLIVRGVTGPVASSQPFLV